ncbi:hypothetical protein Tco_0657602, partial [Tanacetum coccineum]
FALRFCYTGTRLETSGLVSPSTTPASSEYMSGLGRASLAGMIGSFFLRAIPDYMPWRHPSLAINDLKPPAGSYSQEDVRRLSAHVVKLRDMPEGVLVLSGLSRVSIISCACPSGPDLKFKRSLIIILGLLYRGFLSTAPPANIDAAIPDPTLKDLVAGTPSVKVMAKVEASKKHTFGATPSIIAKRIRSAMAQSFRETSRPNLFVGDDDNDDACVEIPLITPIYSTATIPTRGNKSEGSAPSATEGPSTRDSRGKAIMSDVANASSEGDDRSWTSASPTPTFRDLSGDAIQRDFFPFTPGPYYATYSTNDVVAGSYGVSREEWDGPHQPTLTILTKEIFKDPSVCKTVVDQFPTSEEMVRIKALIDDQLAAKMSVLYCLMMSHGGELLARYRGLLKSHHDYVQSVDSRLRVLQEKCSAYQGLESQVSIFKRHVADLNDKLSSSDVALVKAKDKGKDRKKKIKSLSKNLDHLTAEVARLSSTLNQATVLEAERDVEIIRLRASSLEFASFFQSGTGFECGLSMDRTPEEFSVVLKKVSRFIPGARDRIVEASPLLAGPEIIPPQKTICVSPPLTKKSTVTPASSSLELLSNVIPSSSVVVVVKQPSTEQNEE